MYKKIFKYCLIVFTSSLLLACNLNSLTQARKESAKIADEKNQDIIIAFVESSSNKSLFKQGVELAIEEINQTDSFIDMKKLYLDEINNPQLVLEKLKQDPNKQITNIIYDENGEPNKVILRRLNVGGGVLVGRKIIPKFYDDEGKAKIGRKIAQDISKNTDIVAVIGHNFSSVAIPISIIYEQNGIVFISTGATNPLLTAYKRTYIFRNIPSDKKIGKALAKFSRQYNFRRIAIIFERGYYGKRLAEFFTVEAENQDIEIVATRSFFQKNEEEELDFRTLLSEIRELHFDAIFIASYVNKATKIINQARGMGISVPFIGGDSLDNLGLWEQAKLNSVGTFVASVFDPNLSAKSKTFIDNFKAKFDGEMPDTDAAQAYDATKLLAWSIKNGGSTIPLEIATSLRYAKTWENIVGPYKFTLKGDVVGRPIYIKMLTPTITINKINDDDDAPMIGEPSAYFKKIATIKDE